MYTTYHKPAKSLLKKFETPSALMMLDGNILKTYMRPDIEYTEEDSDENIATVWDDVKDMKFFHLIVPDSSTQISIDVRNYTNEPFESLKRAEAIIIKSLAHRILAKFYVKPRQNRYPTRIFDTEAEALAWFAELEEQQNA